MAVRLPILTPSDALETFVYSMNAACTHYPGRYEDEISGPWPWKFARVADGYNGVMVNCRISIRQTIARDLGRSWNCVDNNQYAIVSRTSNTLGTTYPATANYPIADSRAFLRGAIYAAKAFVAMHPNLQLPVKYFDSAAGFNKTRNDPWVLWTEGQLADGNAYCVLEGNIPLIAGTAETTAAWLAIDLSGLPTPTPALPAAYAAMS